MHEMHRYLIQLLQDCHRCRLTFSPWPLLCAITSCRYPLLITLISDEGFALRFRKISDTYSNDNIHLIPLISLFLIHRFNTAISIRNRFSLTTLKILMPLIVSDCVWIPQLVFLLYMIFCKVLLYIKLSPYHLIMQYFFCSQKTASDMS